MSDAIWYAWPRRSVKSQVASGRMATREIELKPVENARTITPVACRPGANARYIISRIPGFPSVPPPRAGECICHVGLVAWRGVGYGAGPRRTKGAVSGIPALRSLRSLLAGRISSLIDARDRDAFRGPAPGRMASWASGDLRARLSPSPPRCSSICNEGVRANQVLASFSCRVAAQRDGRASSESPIAALCWALSQPR